MGTGYGDEHDYEGCIYDTIPCDQCNSCGKYKMCPCCESRVHYTNGSEFQRETENGIQKIWLCNSCINIFGYF